MMPTRIALDDLPSLVGREIGVSDWLTIDQSRIDAFAKVTDDQQWIHVDRQRATAEIGGTIAHGFLTLAMLSSLAGEIFVLAGVRQQMNYGFDRLRFTAAVKAGNRIRLRLTLAEVTSKGDAVQSRHQCVIEIEGGDRPALLADWLTLAYPSST